MVPILVNGTFYKGNIEVEVIPGQKQVLLNHMRRVSLKEITLFLHLFQSLYVCMYYKYSTGLLISPYRYNNVQIHSIVLL